MSWKSVHKEDNALLDESDFWFHRLFRDKILLSFEDESVDSLNPKASTISLATSHLVISCCVSQAMISCFLDTADKTETTSHRESDLLGTKETHSGVWESNELQVWDSRQNSRYAEYGELYEAFSRLVK